MARGETIPTSEVRATHWTSIIETRFNPQRKYTMPRIANALRSLAAVITPVTFEVYTLEQGPKTPCAGEPGKFHYPPVRANESAHYSAEAAMAACAGLKFPSVVRMNERGAYTAHWIHSPHMGWQRMSDAPGFSDWERLEAPHNNF